MLGKLANCHLTSRALLLPLVLKTEAQSHAPPRGDELQYQEQSVTKGHDRLSDNELIYLAYCYTNSWPSLVDKQGCVQP